MREFAGPLLKEFVRNDVQHWWAWPPDEPVV
jgi:hypothetical protein